MWPFFSDHLSEICREAATLAWRKLRNNHENSLGLLFRSCTVLGEIRWVSIFFQMFLNKMVPFLFSLTLVLKLCNTIDLVMLLLTYTSATEIQIKLSVCENTIKRTQLGSMVSAGTQLVPTEINRTPFIDFSGLWITPWEPNIVLAQRKLNQIFCNKKNRFF